jgi:hypothetical protein
MGEGARICCINFFISLSAFKRNFVSGPISNIELYQMMCDILGLEPHANNGTWSNVAPMLVRTDTSSGRSMTISLLLLIIAVTTSTLRSVFYLH